MYVDPVICAAGTKAKLFECLMYFYLGGTRTARQVLEQQNRNTSRKREQLRKLCELAHAFWTLLVEGGDILSVGELLHEAWQSKKQLADNISNSEVDDAYEQARRAGALGGKLLGAGIGGFLMLFCEPAKQPAVREALRGFRHLDFGFEPEGSKIIYVGE